MTNKHHTTLYVGVTSQLYYRVIDHQEKLYPNSFTARYNLNKLIFYEDYGSILEAIAREKEIKGWVRARKVALINEMNSEWRDLFEDMKDW